MKRWLIIGAGDVAERMVPYLQHRVRLFALCRSKEKAQHWRSKGVYPILGDLDQPHTLQRLSGIAQGVFHFAPPANQGTQDLRTRHLLSALSRTHSLPQQLVYISTTGVYGDCQGRWINETTPLNPQSERAKRRVDAETCLRQFAQRHRVNLVILRAPGIYADNRLPLNRFKERLPLMIESEDSWSNHIHAEDLARLAIHTMYHHHPCRVFNAVDNVPMMIGHFYDLLARYCGFDPLTRLPRNQVKTMISEISWSFMAESRKITNRRITDELSFRLSFPSVEHCLKQLSLPPQLVGKIN